LLTCAQTEQPLWTSCPRAGWLAGAEARYMEHEQPFGELEMVSPDGQIVHHLDWNTLQPVPLLKNVMRLTAPNPGVMTGPGTNSYLVGDPNTGYIAIDPGPADAEHIERLWRAAGGDIRMIVCTHSHADHSPGAKPLQALCAQAPHGRPPILGLPSQPTARANSDFTPDRALANQEHLTLTAKSIHADTTHTLKVIHTPGHAANHLCLVLVEDGLLFSGDHILNGSTTVVDPPDGEMTAYLDSLDVLTAACSEHNIHFILPAHGYVLGQAAGAISHLKAHRLKREAKILKVMQAQPQGSMDDWVAKAYDDVPPRMWPVAKRSLLAHVQRIEAMQA
jgi:recombination protein RecT